MSDSTAYQGWAIVELMGHRRLAGRVSEVTQYGTTQLRLDVPGEGDTIAATQFYSGGALYCVTPTDEKTARAVARLGRPEPVQRWELPAPKREEAAEVSEGEEPEERDVSGDNVDF
jgi:hypothetical protein